jgi:DNA-binding MarR family transcriptional regulator
MDEWMEKYDWAEEYDPIDIAGWTDRPRRRRKPPRYIDRKVPQPLGGLAGLMMIAAAHEAEKVYADTLKPYDISRHGLAALAVVARSPGISLMGLAERLGVSRQHASATVARLVALGVVDRAVHPRDGRRVELDLTDDGSRTLRAACAALDAADALWASRMAVLDRDELTQVLERLLATGLT